jgi:hypothetical protein
LVCHTSTQIPISTQNLKPFYRFLTTTIMNSYSKIENRISKACEAAKRVKTPNISALSREFNVSYHRLRARLQKQATCSTRKSTNKALTDMQEKVLIN